MGEWVLIWIVIATQIPDRTVQTAPVPIYFHDQAACQAVAKALKDPEHKGVLMGGKCFRTRSGDR